MNTYASPCGELLLGEYNGRLCLCDWIRQGRGEVNSQRMGKRLGISCQIGTTKFLKQVEKELDEYFSGQRTEFDVPIYLVGTEFQMEVWEKLVDIPYGRTISYSELAKMIGQPRSVRAVANAVGANPISIIVPCHRVVGTDGSLTGYAGGLPAKQTLLALETPCGNLGNYD